MLIQRFEANADGRDFAVGDVHGCFHLLKDELERVGFDEERDRLFSVGDLVDRGPDSECAIDWITRPWFHAVQGNHESMAVGVAAGRHDLGNYMMRGGAWFLALPEARQKLYAEIFATLPLMIEVAHPAGRVGIVHADVGESWDGFIAQCGEAESNTKRRRLTETAQWSRSRIHAHEMGYPTAKVADLDVMIVGHTPVKAPTMLANVFYIDTGSHRTGKVTVMELGEIIARREA